jgi:hypothetical protein
MILKTEYRNYVDFYVKSTTSLSLRPSRIATLVAVCTSLYKHYEYSLHAAALVYPKYRRATSSHSLLDVNLPGCSTPLPTDNIFTKQTPSSTVNSPALLPHLLPLLSHTSSVQMATDKVAALPIPSLSTLRALAPSSCCGFFESNESNPVPMTSRIDSLDSIDSTPSNHHRMPHFSNEEPSPVIRFRGRLDSQYYKCVFTSTMTFLSSKTSQYTIYTLVPQIGYSAWDSIFAVSVTTTHPLLQPHPLLQLYPLLQFSPRIDSQYYKRVKMKPH